ncbi:hypothetical protein [Staphylococcus shinii]|uniref:hypothetical protein n=1 Tax=Staphylococcus shinii TaxID=2912228 RepID=UPI003EEC17C1
MIKTANYFTEVNFEEYQTMYEFYVTELGFYCLSGDYATVLHFMDLLQSEGKLHTVIEGLKCGDDYSIYTDGEA